MIYNITTVLLLQAASSDISLSGFHVGYLQYKGGSVRVPWWGGQILNTFTLYLICNKLSYISGSANIYPLFKLTAGRSTAKDIYQVDGCNQYRCSELYLECNDFPFTLGHKGVLQMSFKSKSFPVCFDKPLTSYEAVGFCQGLNLPSLGAELLPVLIENYNGSWEIEDPCFDRSSFSCTKHLRLIQQNRCQPSDLITLKCPDVDPVFRLVEGDTGSHRGTLEMNVGLNRYSVCATNFTLNDATVICRSMGYSPSTDCNYHARRVGTTGRVRYVGNFQCTGMESDVKYCSRTTSDYSFCSSPYIVEISCATAQEGKLRLTGGYDTLSGRLEIYQNGTWGTVCANGFGQMEVNVACKQMTGRTGERIAAVTVLPLTGFDDVALFGVTCAPHDVRLEQCRHDLLRTGDTPNCISNSIVHLACSEEPRFRMNVTNQDPGLLGVNQEPGLLEVYHDRHWGTICNVNYTFGRREAKVACRSLNLPSIFAGVETSAAATAVSQTRIWLDRLTCGAHSIALKNCSFGKWGEVDKKCSPQDDVYLSCPNPATFGSFSMHGTEAGIVSVYFRTTDVFPNVICIKNRLQNVATVACRSLRKYTERATLLPENVTPGVHNETAILNVISCTGRESNLFGCRNSPFDGPIQCESSHKLAVACGTSKLPDYSLRLVSPENADNKHLARGRLQVMMYGVWGSVCHTGFTDKSAKVACRQLGLPWSLPKRKPTVRSHGKSELSWLTNVACSGEEIGLVQCSKTIQFHSKYMNGEEVCEQYLQCDEYIVPSKLIAGCVVSGILVIGLIVTIVCCCKKKTGKCCTKSTPRPHLPGVRYLTPDENFLTPAFTAPSAPVMDMTDISTISRSQEISPVEPNAPADPSPLIPEELKPPPSYNELFPDRPYDESYQQSSA